MGGRPCAPNTIAVHDAGHQPVSNATVSGDWSGAFSGADLCTTDSSGQCSVTSGGIRKRYKKTSFTVNDVIDSVTYESENNHDPDGDSNGTIITVSKP